MNPLYIEKRLEVIETILVQHGITTRDEIASLTKGIEDRYQKQVDDMLTRRLTAFQIGQYVTIRAAASGAKGHPYISGDIQRIEASPFRLLLRHRVEDDNIDIQWPMLKRGSSYWVGDFRMSFNGYDYDLESGDHPIMTNPTLLQR